MIKTKTKMSLDELINIVGPVLKASPVAMTKGAVEERLGIELPVNWGTTLERHGYTERRSSHGHGRGQYRWIAE